MTKLIYYQGLNCHLASIINIAARIGINYFEAYATLWSETEFKYETKYQIYSSKRFLRNLRKIGLEKEIIETGKDFTDLPEGSYVLVGMDIFCIPWHALYNHFHDSHFFFARAEGDYFECFDPVYGKEGFRFKRQQLLANAFEVSYLHKGRALLSNFDIRRQAEQIVKKHPELTSKLLFLIGDCIKQREAITPLIKLITAMINNRCLFVRYLEHSGLAEPDMVAFDNKFFAKWDAVKNGLYKGKILKENKAVLEHSAALLGEVMKQEVAFARYILS